MKYLKKYNESIASSSDKVDTCMELTGYTYDELVDLFTLNLEDNSEFEVVSITGYLLPTHIHNFHYINRSIVSIEITEDISSENAELLNNAIHNLRNSMQVAQREYHISIFNKKLLDMIGKKYDLKIGKFELRGMLGGNRYRVAFTVEKNNTTA